VFASGERQEVPKIVLELSGIHRAPLGEIELSTTHLQRCGGLTLDVGATGVGG